MDYLNEIQVQSTNDASTVSKFSAVSKNYFKDDYIQEFVVKKKSRASLIHLGYYTRAIILNMLLNNFIGFLNRQKVLKIISLGAGFDTTYWKLSEMSLLENCVFVEIDFPSVIRRKIEIINQSQRLSSILQKSSCSQNQNKVKKLSFNYYLLEADLSNLSLVEKLFNEIDINYKITTLFLSECVITYMRKSDSRKLIDWMSIRFKNCAFINYEQFHPDDGFGQVMLEHFEKMQSSLLSVSEYPDCKSHYFRFKNHGFETSCCLSEWDALVRVVSEEERRRVFLLELFDEYEEFHLKCTHYIVAVAANGMASDWVLTTPLANAHREAISRPLLESLTSKCDLELFRHFSCNANETVYVFGGCTRRKRSWEIYRISFEDNNLNVTAMKNSDQNIRLDMVYGSGACFELNGLRFVCLYGGRTSPDKVWNDGRAVVCEVVAETLLQREVVREESPPPRYRTSMVSLNCSESKVTCWIFGGRTTDLKISLSDFWKLTIKYNENTKTITAKWTQQEQKNANSWPCGRMSHSFTASPDSQELYLIGGLKSDASAVLNDVWKWSCSDDCWEEVKLRGTLLPRYGHTSHLRGGVIYLVGGVNTDADAQPGLAGIDLTTLTVVEYDISSPTLTKTLLFNHVSQICENGEDSRLWIIGGGGNCFSFGTHINRNSVCIRLAQITKR